MASLDQVSSAFSSSPADQPSPTLGLPPGFDALAEYSELVTVLVDALEHIETELSEALTNADQIAESASRHLLVAGGKRVRPLLTLLSALLGDPKVSTGEVGAPSEQARTIAVVMELTHLATLYHDDVMDEADLRRDAPTAHRQWNNSVAILAGDLVFARASQQMSSMGPEAIKAHADTFESLVMGQLWETVGPQGGADPLEHYLKVIDGKTASLISTSARLGALVGGCDEETIELMSTYGQTVGIAFQLADDIIDLTAENSGKERGTDLKERVPTLPVLLLRDAARGVDGADAAVASSEVASAREVLALIDGPLDTEEQLTAAVDAISAHPVIEQSWEMTRQWSQRAIAALEPLPDSPVKSALVDFANYVVNRES